MTTAALIVAAGRGTRFGGTSPKQYLPLLGAPLLRWTLQAFLDHPAVDHVLTVIHEDDRQLFDAAASGLSLLPPVTGGATRQLSVRAGLEALARQGVTQVLIHDAARPLVPAALIDRVLAALKDNPGALPALPVVDSLRRVTDGFVSGSVDRDGLMRAQTPQGFRLGDILATHRAADHEDFTDDAAILQASGGKVHVVMGHEETLKVTTPEDLLQVERLILNRLGDIRSASGFDVHRFTDGDHVTLCGVRVPHTQALLGHSDADVGLHALTDALLGALAEGDIGAVFPPSDPQWRGVDSAVFLAHARDRVAARGGVIAHVDVTLICERPKIGPHRDQMRGRIAEILRISLDRVSVKATTTEELGFTGRREGIAAQAMATVRLP
ncbi:bifunctional 2-C-methyl-D-erythritol 4-phosphate cytidylyltransferase/2-C-methyl-D-erythritol 2,4-cyclodiphosphate synthase [Govanella unica]|uniref:Bifunctional enzyme IspD/IspF n=1 Tax=Govanella unica TaxID=2975056 RepID=A0A9X3TXX1_9PROT|nr:bifunctional 2-C-methyl-D-erythritol 4-phosphate cytidylyltransferase/2-C-methyl-D-erythritol 2,4-cyclodiphosphate synthase [Govania unica]MDA5193811.1 bifunctional 2-C-methyl-D-erythritol 4-phosphate cytidylyltransferase/2-C-methyl-D-erythritol 2,4-cyclodiphosphate synthase [Govania unica]